MYISIYVLIKSSVFREINSLCCVYACIHENAYTRNTRLQTDNGRGTSWSTKW